MQVKPETVYILPLGAISNLMVSGNDNEDDDLSKLVENFWKIEMISDQRKFLTEEEQECEQIFIKSIRRDFWAIYYENSI